MDHNVTVLERAFQLARSGDCVSVEAIKVKLKDEGYSLAQIAGPTLRKQLLDFIREARALRPRP